MNCPSPAPKDRYSAASISDYDLHAEEGTHRDDIFRLYANMRDKCPVSYTSNNDGHFTVARYDDVRNGLSDWETFSSAQGIMTPRFKEHLTLIEMDPPEAKFWRNLVQKDLTEKAVGERYSDSIREDVNHLLDDLSDRQTFDLVTEFAELLPVLVVGTVIGARSRGRELRDLTLQITANQSDPERIAEIAGQMSMILIEEIKVRESKPGDDLLSRYAKLRIDGEPLPLEKLLMFVQVLILAGNTTTVSGLSAMLKYLLSDEQLRLRVLEDPATLNSAIDESLRLSPPLLHFARTTTRETEIRGQRIGAGESVVFVYASGNMDPEEFPNPEEFRLDRPNRHLSFGWGIHRCVGSHLAKLEIRIAVQELFRRFPDIELAIPSDHIFAHVHGGNEMKYASLPVKRRGH